MSKAAHDPRPLGGAQWQRRGPYVYIDGRAHLDGVDALAVAMERKWGIDRLRLLVPAEMRAAFDRQRAKLNAAMWHGDLSDVEREADRMCNAWRALDQAATAAGATGIEAEVLLEIPMGGMVVTVVRDATAAHAIQGDGRLRQTWTVDELSRVIEAFPEVVRAKHTFPGAEVVWSRPIIDPLRELVDDEIPDFM